MRGSLLLLGAAVLGGCLFPSFDDLGPTGKGTLKSTSSSSSSGSDASSEPEPKGDAAAPFDAGDALGITCGDNTCLHGSAFCCLSVGGSTPNCQPSGAVGTCNFQIDGKAFQCDGDEDCGSGQVCCVVDGEAACAAACAGPTLCNSAISTCPAGKSCSGTISGFKACQ